MTETVCPSHQICEICGICGYQIQNAGAVHTGWKPMLLCFRPRSLSLEGSRFGPRQPVTDSCSSRRRKQHRCGTGQRLPGRCKQRPSRRRALTKVQGSRTRTSSRTINFAPAGQARFVLTPAAARPRAQVHAAVAGTDRDRDRRSVWCTASRVAIRPDHR